MRAVDTNVLVRLLARDDPRQVAAVEDFIASGAWVPLIALIEAAWVLDSVYGVGAKQMATAIEMLLEHKTLAIQDAETVALALEHHRRRPSVGFSDCVLLEVARKAGHLPLGTFDRHLSKLDGAQKL